MNSLAFFCNEALSLAETLAPVLPFAFPLAVPLPFGDLLGVSDAGALGDYFTPPRSPTSAISISPISFSLDFAHLNPAFPPQASYINLPHPSE